MSNQQRSVKSTCVSYHSYCLFVMQVSCAAFCACSSLVIATQKKAKFFTLVLQGAKKGHPSTQLWRNMLPSEDLSFLSDSEEFSHTSQLHQSSGSLSRAKYVTGQQFSHHVLGRRTSQLTQTQSSLISKISSSQFSSGYENDCNKGAPLNCFRT